MLERPHLPLAQAHAVRLTKIDIHLPEMDFASLGYVPREGRSIRRCRGMVAILEAV
jgi:hypothetical protein